MFFGVVSLVVALGIAGWLLWRLAGSDGSGNAARKNVTLLKIVVLMLLTAALFSAQLRIIALMVLLAAGGVMAIESWREKHIGDDQVPDAPPPNLTGPMDRAEASAVLGVGIDADADDVITAHRKLIAQIHPDKGGTDYLAAKINEAREVMLETQPKEH